MTLRKRFWLAFSALVLPTLLFVGYVAAKPAVRKLAIRATVPLFVQLPSGQSFVGLVAVTEDYANCPPGDGCPHPTGQKLYAVRADGMEAWQFWEYSPSGDKFLLQTIIDGNGVRTITRPFAKMKTTWRVRTNNPIDRRGARPNPMKNCLESMQGSYPFASLVQFSGMEDLLATDSQTKFHTAKFHVATETADTDFWLAPELGCMELRSEYNWKPASDGRTFKKTTHITRSVQLGNPPEDLYTVPADFLEVKPSDAAHATFVYKAKLAGTSDSQAEQSWQEMPDVKLAGLKRGDESYLTHRANTP